MQIFSISFGSYEDVHEVFLYHPDGMPNDEFNELCKNICKEFLKNYSPKSIYTRYYDICDNLEKELTEKHGFVYPEWRQFYLDDGF